MMNCVFAMTRRVNAVARLLMGQYTKVGPVLKRKIKMLVCCKKEPSIPMLLKSARVI